MRTSSRTATVLAVVAAAALAWWLLRGDAFPPPGGVEEHAPAPPAALEEEGEPRFPRPGTPHPELPRTPVASASAPATPGAAPSRSPASKPREAFPEGPAAVGEVVGVVLLLPERTPVSGAVVRLIGGGPGREVAPYPAISSATTGDNGIFRIEGFAPGAYVFEAAVGGRSPRQFRATIPETGGVDGIEILLGAGGAVEGRVDGPSGPAAEVAVKVNRSGTGGGPGFLARRTDAGGNYRFEDLPSGDYSVEVGERDSGGRSGSVTVEAGRTVRLDFPAGASVSGTILDEAGDAVPDAYVRVIRVGGPYASTQTRTGKEGAYRLDAIEPGAVRIQVQVTGEGGYAMNVLDATLVPGENRADIRFGQGPSGAGIAGRIFERATGAPVGAPAQVTLYAAEEKDGEAGPATLFWGSAFADAQGRFRFPALMAGAYRLVVQPNRRGLAMGAAEVVLRPGERRMDLEIGLDPWVPPERRASVAALSGVVADADGRPLAGAYVRLHSAANMDIHRQGKADDSGRYRVEELDPGDWKVHVQVLGTDGFALEVAETAIRTGENSLDIRLGTGEFAGEIRGRVFAASSRRPLSWPEIQIALLALQPDGSPRYTSSAQVDGGGVFRFPYVRAGRYRIHAAPMAGGLAQKEVDVSCGPGEKVSGVEVALDELRTGKVRFSVRDPEGKPVLLVSIESLKDGKRQQGSMTANSHDGFYETNFEVGTHTVRVRDVPGGKLTADLTVEVKEGATARVEVVLQPTAEGR